MDTPQDSRPQPAPDADQGDWRKLALHLQTTADTFRKQIQRLHAEQAQLREALERLRHVYLHEVEWQDAPDPEYSQMRRNEQDALDAAILAALASRQPGPSDEPQR